MDMNLILRQDFAAVTILLLALGAVLKYRTPLDNKLIPKLCFLLLDSASAQYGAGLHPHIPAQPDGLMHCSSAGLHRG